MEADIPSQVKDTHVCFFRFRIVFIFNVYLGGAQRTTKNPDYYLSGISSMALTSTP